MRFLDRLRKEARDQSAHIALAVASFAPVMIWPGALTGIGCGFLFGLALEVKEEGSTVTLASIRKALGSRLDLTFYAVTVGVLGAILG